PADAGGELSSPLIIQPSQTLICIEADIVRVIRGIVDEVKRFNLMMQEEHPRVVARGHEKADLLGQVCELGQQLDDVNTTCICQCFVQGIDKDQRRFLVFPLIQLHQWFAYRAIEAQFVSERAEVEPSDGNTCHTAARPHCIDILFDSDLYTIG